MNDQKSTPPADNRYNTIDDRQQSRAEQSRTEQKTPIDYQHFRGTLQMEPVFGLGVVPMPKWQDFQNLPDHTKGPVTLAEELGKQQRQAISQQISSNMQAGDARVRMHYGKLLTQGVNVWA